MKDAINSIQAGLQEQGYLCDEQTATVLFLAEQLSKPILVEGPAGVGKTAVAKAFAQMKNVPLVRLQCYEGIDEAKAIYEWNYKKQLIHIQASVNNQDVTPGQLEKEVFSQEFLLARPLLQVVMAKSKCCLLIDEIDKVDFEFEAMLLELLSEFQVTLPEIGTIQCEHIPYIFLTSNATRELSEALKRRCLLLYLSYPSEIIEKAILELNVPDLEAALINKMTATLHQLRAINLRKPPSIAEGIDWAAALKIMGASDLDQPTIAKTFNIILKYQADISRAAELLGSSGI